MKIEVELREGSMIRLKGQRTWNAFVSGGTFEIDVTVEDVSQAAFQLGFEAGLEQGYADGYSVGYEAGADEGD